MVAFGGKENRYNLSVVPFRLSLLTGDGFPASDLTNQSTLYWTPWGGNAVALYNGSNWREHIVTERSIALSGLTPWRLYDVFVYDNAGTITLELTAWNAPASGTVSGATNATPIVITTSAAHGRSVNDLVYISGVGGNTAANCATGVPWRVLSVPTATTFSIGTQAGANVSGSGAFTSNGSWYLADYTSHSRATALTTQDGVYVKTGATTRRYLGTICTTSASTTSDNLTQRLVWNFYNQVDKYIIKNSNSSHSYDGAARPWNNDVGNAIYVVSGQQAQASNAVIAANQMAIGAAGRTALTLMGQNSRSSSNVNVAASASSGTVTMSGGNATIFAPTAGLHYLQAMESTNSSGSCTFPGYNITFPYKC